MASTAFTHGDNVRIASELNQMLLTVHKRCGCPYKNTLLHGSLYLIVNWGEVWTVQRPHIQLNKV